MHRAAAPHAAGRCIRGRPGISAGSRLQRPGRSGRRRARPATRRHPRPAGARRRTHPPRPVPRAVRRAALECPGRRAGGRPRAHTRRSTSSPRLGEEGRLACRHAVPRPGSLRWEPRCRSPRIRSPTRHRESSAAPPRAGQPPGPSRCAVWRRALAVGDASPAGFLASCRPSCFQEPGRAPPVGLSGYAIELHCKGSKHRLHGSLVVAMKPTDC